MSSQKRKNARIDDFFCKKKPKVTASQSAQGATEEVVSSSAEPSSSATAARDSPSVTREEGAPILSVTEHDGPMQPILTTYPERNKRRFQSSFYEKFPWIEYSVSTNEVFCFSCRHFAKNIIFKGETEGKKHS